MDSKQTHYETLSIARSAPDFLIRAAFKSLSQKYHPDVNPNDEDSHSKMVAINYAYQTLSDEGKRKAYDLWLDRQSSPSNLEPKGDSNRNSPFDQPLKSRRRRPSIWSFAGTLVSFVCLVFISIFSLDDPSAAYVRSLVKAALQQQIPFHAPSDSFSEGLSAGTEPTGYLKGHRQQSMNGHRSLLVSNRNNEFDISARLVGPNKNSSNIIRFFNIAKYESFVINGLDDLYYEIRFHNLEEGSFHFIPLDFTETGDVFHGGPDRQVVDLARSLSLSESNYFLSTPAVNFYPEKPLLEKLVRTISGENELFAPNGQPLPKPSGLVSGYRQVKTAGLNRLVVHNNDADYPLFSILEMATFDRFVRKRTFHVGPGSELLLDGLQEGSYRFRYQYVSREKAFLTESFFVSKAAGPTIDTEKAEHHSVVISQLKRIEVASLY